MLPIFIVLVTLVIAFSLFLIVDFSISFYEWQSRIHMGKWEDREKWQIAMENTARTWLKTSPTVRVSSNTRLILWDILRGNFRNKTIQTWQDAGLLFGLAKEDVVDYVKIHQITFLSEKLNPEDLLLAYVLKKSKALNPEMEKNILEWLQAIVEDGTIYYRLWVKNLRFVDTIGMVLPFLHVCNRDDLAIRQLEEYDKALLYDVYPAHAFDIEINVPLGVHDWCRGIGWYILGVVETADLPGNDIRIVRLAEAMIQHQKSDGSFSCFFFNKQERSESSGTALIGLLFIKAFEISNDYKYIDAAKRVESALMKATRRDGALDYCQGDTYSIGHYSQCFSVMPFAQGIAIMFSKRLDTYLNANN